MTTAMRILHVVDSVGAKAAGVAGTVRPLIQAQAALGGEIGYVTGDGVMADDLPNAAPAAGFLSSRVWRCIRWADVVHIHALWLWSTSIAGHASLLTRKPYVITPYGMLDAWALSQSRWKKRVFRWLAEDRILSHAAAIHALCAPEAAAVRKLGFGNPVVVIPPGLDIDLRSNADASCPRQPVVLFLGRLHPKKGVDILSAAFERIAWRHPAWRLVIAGPDQAALRGALEARARAAGLDARTSFVGPVYGAEKAALLRSAAVFALPSHSEGVPMAALEAMAHGVPVAISKACNLAEVEAAGAGFVGDADPHSMAQVLDRLMTASDAQRAAMGERGRELIAHRFLASVVAKRYLDVYRWIRSGGEPPQGMEIANAA
jgi:poly(glycerol-phosphate) alpha-glucosyltransferase